MPKQPLRNKVIGAAIGALDGLQNGLIKFMDLTGIATTPKITNTSPGYASRQTAYPVPLLPTENGQPQDRQYPIGPERFSRTGTKSFAGFVMEDYLAIMQGRNAIEKFDEMYRSDSQVYAAVRRGNKKLKNCDVYFEPVDQDDPVETEIAEALDYNFFSGNCMKKIWRDYMNEILTVRRYGLSAFEPTFGIIDHPEFGTMWIIKDLGWISPKTIWQMFVVNNYVWSFRQISTGDDYSYVDIPGEGLLVFSYDSEGNNLWGMSPLRPMYASYLFKDIARQVNAMGMENNARGAWVAETPEDKIGGKAAVARADSLNNFTQGTIPWIENIKGWLLTFYKIDYQADAVLKSMAQYNADISKCVQAEHQELGLNDVGAKAMNKSKEESEDESLMDDMKYICEKFAPLIKWFVIKNYGERPKYPKMMFNGLESKPTYEHAQSIALLTTAGYISPANKVQKAWVADTFGVPGGDDIEEGEVSGDDTTGGQQGGQQGAQDPGEVVQEGKEHGPLIQQIISDAKQGKEKSIETYAAQIAAAHHKMHEHKTFKKLLSEFVPRRTLTDYEAKINFAEIKNTFDGLDEKYGDLIARSFKDFIIPKYKKALRSALESSGTQSAKHSAINHVELGGKTKLISLVKDFMTGAVIEGRKQAAGEMKGKRKKFAENKTVKVSELSPGVYGWVKGHAENAVNAQYATITKVMTLEAQNGLDNNLTDDQIVFNAAESGEEYVDKTRNTGEQIIPVQSVNEGRFSLFQEYKDQIQGFQYSAVLDESTCDYCAALDGATFQIDDPDSIPDCPPIHPACRCILIPILMDEETPEWDGLPEAITEYVSDPENDISLEDIQKLKKFTEVVQ
jgi:hypothetical protein